jgi:hypothetical protein
MKKSLSLIVAPSLVGVGDVFRLQIRSYAFNWQILHLPGPFRQAPARRQPCSREASSIPKIPFGSLVAEKGHV